MARGNIQGDKGNELRKVRFRGGKRQCMFITAITAKKASHLQFDLRMAQQCKNRKQVCELTSTGGNDCPSVMFFQQLKVSHACCLIWSSYDPL